MQPELVAVIVAHLLVVTTGFQAAYETETSISQNHEYAVPGRRMKRGTPKAIAQILGKAKLIRQFGSHRQYSTDGGHAQALKDFQNLKLTDIEGTKLSKQGRVGDVTVFMTDGLPYGLLTFFRKDKKKFVIDTIRYYD